MNKLEIGMYIRTIEGVITRVIDNRDNVIIKTDDYTTLLRSKVKNAQSNVLDLLEAGDIIVYKHPAIDKEYTERIADTKTLEIRRLFFEEGSLELVSVLTREQFEINQYKVKTKTLRSKR